MAYIPPHMRQSKGAAAAPSPSPPPESMSTRFQRNLDLQIKNQPKKIIYSEGFMSKWFVVGLADESRVSDLTRLEPVDMESSDLPFERKPGEKPLALVLKGSLSSLSLEAVQENYLEANEISKNPWDFVAERVKLDLFSSLQKVKDQTESSDLIEFKPTLILRFGKVLFHGNHSFTFESMIGSSQSTETLRKMRKSFFTNVPSYAEHITKNTVPKFDFKFEEKEFYQVKLYDNMQPGSTISCKCTVAKDTNQLELFKLELNQLRNLVENISCLDKKVDLRLMLCTKRNLVSLTDEELENIKILIGSARLDSEVKGGLRWPLGKQFSGDRYCVVGVWHTIFETYSNSSMKLKVRHANRFDFRASSGEVGTEVYLTMPGVISLLREQNVNPELAMEMLKENLELVWKHFLVCDSLT